MMYTRTVLFAALIMSLAGCTESPVTPAVKPPAEPPAQTFGILQLIVRDGGGFTPAGTSVELVHEKSQKRRQEAVPTTGQLEITSIESGRWTITVSAPPSHFVGQTQKTKPADVQASQTTRVEFWITPIPNDNCIDPSRPGC